MVSDPCRAASTRDERREMVGIDMMFSDDSAERRVWRRDENLDGVNVVKPQTNNNLVVDIALLKNRAGGESKSQA